MQTETTIGWQDYLAVVIRRRWFFLTPCLLIMGLAMVVGLFLPKIYRAETLLLVQDQQVINPLIQGLAVSTPVSERMRTLREELLSWTSLSRLVHELGMDRQVREPLAFERLVKQLQRQILVGMRGRDLVTISYEDHNPELAQRLVNTITNIYMQRSVESQSAEAGTAISFLESEMAVYKKKLEGAERALRDFKELYIMQMPVATQLNEQVITLEVELSTLLVEDTEAHPTVVQMRRQIEELKRKRNEELKRVIAGALAKGRDPEVYQDLLQAIDSPASAAGTATLQVAKEAYQAWVKRMDRPMAEAQAGPTHVQVVTPAEGAAASSVEVLGGATSISLAPRQEQELAQLTRDYQVHSKTYQSMQERLEKAKVTQRLGESDEGTKFKVLEPARLPLRPIKPNVVKLFVFSLLLGAFVGGGIAFLAEYLDQSFQSAEELQAMLELPVIGTISTIITTGDLEARRTRVRGWLSWKANLGRLRTQLLQPVWMRVDQALLRWGL